MARRRRRLARQRRGVVALWLILALPVLVLLLCFVIEIGNVWLARTELENALEAAALAGVKQWGDASGGLTGMPRQVANTYSQANTVTGTPVTLNTTVGVLPNGNVSCTGDLVFGAVTTLAPPHVLDTTATPGCGVGRVMIDATSSGGLDSGNDNDWGIAFQQTSPLTPSALRITKIEIDLGSGATFSPTPAVSPNTVNGLANNAVRDTSPQVSQADVFGFSNPNAQIQFSGIGTQKLTITFLPDPPSPAPPTDDGFAVGDRFRFGAAVTNGGQVGGDDVGYPNRTTTITVYYNDSTVASGILIDTDDRSNQCYNTHHIDPITGTWVVSPSNVPDLPCPQNSGAKNGQSYVVIYGAGQGAFGVRAQTSAPVNSVCCQLFNYTLPTFQVSACATARYDCGSRRPELIRVRPENVICP